MQAVMREIIKKHACILKRCARLPRYSYRTTTVYEINYAIESDAYATFGVSGGHGSRLRNLVPKGWVDLMAIDVRPADFEL